MKHPNKILNSCIELLHEDGTKQFIYSQSNTVYEALRLFTNATGFEKSLSFFYNIKESGFPITSMAIEIALPSQFEEDYQRAVERHLILKRI